MLVTEAYALKAIGRLEAEFPYAATLLVYVTLERCLKLFLLEERHKLTNADVDLYKEVGRKKLRLADYRHLDDKTFIEIFLTTCSLGALEALFRMGHNKYSRHRNEVVHSDLYLENQLGLAYEDRHAQNTQYVRTAKEYLIEASTLYFRRRIVDLNGVLRFES